jgi:hypothetical protein
MKLCDIINNLCILVTDLPGMDFYIAASKLLVECNDPESSSVSILLIL